MIRQCLVAVGFVGFLTSMSREQTGPGIGGGGTQYKNVLVIVLDDLGTDKLEFYGETTPSCPVPDCISVPSSCVGRYAATPVLDSLRAQGILFTRAYGNPVCSPTRACIQTGRYGFRTGVGSITNSYLETGYYSVPGQEVLLAELVRDGHPFIPLPSQGLPYKCGAFGKWHLATADPADWSHAVDNGYHRFQGMVGNVVVMSNGQSGSHFKWEKIDDSPSSGPTPEIIDATVSGQFTTAYWQTSHAAADALAWITAQNKSFLAYVCFNAPHAPLQVPPLSLLTDPDTLCELASVPPSGLAAGAVVDLGTHPIEVCRLVYRAMVEALDTEIGNLVNNIPQAKRDNTMIFVIGDNGTPGHLMEAPHVTTEGKGTLYETGIRVPLIVSGPLVPTPPIGGWTSNALVDAVDVWRTIAKITDSNVNDAAPLTPLDSKSFLTVIQNPASAGVRTHVFSQIFNPLFVWPLPLPPGTCFSRNELSISNGTYKYLRLQQTCGPFDEYMVLLPNEVANLLPTTPGTPEHDAYIELSTAMDAILQ